MYISKGSVPEVNSYVPLVLRFNMPGETSYPRNAVKEGSVQVTAQVAEAAALEAAQSSDTEAVTFAVPGVTPVIVAELSVVEEATAATFASSADAHAMVGVDVIVPWPV